MQQFKMSDELVSKVKADLGNRVFPGLLQAVAGLIRPKLLEAVKTEGAKLGDADMPLVPEAVITKFPYKLSITLIADGTSKQKTAYERAFSNCYNLNMADKPKFLKMLYSGGIH